MQVWNVETAERVWKATRPTTTLVGRVGLRETAFGGSEDARHDAFEMLLPKGDTIAALPLFPLDFSLHGGVEALLFGDPS